MSRQNASCGKTCCGGYGKQSIMQHTVTDSTAQFNKKCAAAAVGMRRALLQAAEAVCCTLSSEATASLNRKYSHAQWCPSVHVACCVLHAACCMFFADTAALVHGLGGEDKDVIQRLRGGWFRIVRRHLCKGVALRTVNSHEYDGRDGRRSNVHCRASPPEQLPCRPPRQHAAEGHSGFGARAEKPIIPRGTFDVNARTHSGYSMRSAQDKARQAHAAATADTELWQESESPPTSCSSRSEARPGPAPTPGPRRPATVQQPVATN